MGRPPINLSVLVSSTQDNRFANGKRSFSIRRVSEATGISLRAVRNAYHFGRTSIRKASGEVYSLEWGDPTPPKDTTKCYYCHNALTAKDRSTWFHMDRTDKEEPSKTFKTLYQASKLTGISNNELRNACEKNDKFIARRKGEFARYQIDWHDVCCHCNPPPEKVKGEVKDYVIPAWKWSEDGHIVFL